MQDRLSELRRGWRVLLASAFGVCFGMTGLATFSFGVFVVPLTQAFGWSRGEVTVASSFLLLGNGLTAPVVGGLIDRYGARRIAIGSMVAIPIGYAALSRIGASLMSFYAVYIVLTLAGGGTGNVAWTRAVNMTFDRTRGLALGLILAGSATAAIFAPLLCTKIILAEGWRMGYAALAGIVILLPVPALIMWFRDINAVTRKAAAAGAGFTLAEGIRRPTYWKLAAAFFLVSGGVSFVIVHQVPLLIDRGMSPMEAASLASVFGVAIVVGRLSNGIVADFFHGPYIGALMFAIAGGGCLLLAIADHSTIAAVLSVIAFGLAGGAEIHLLAFLTSRYFGMREYGKIYGCQLMSFYVAGALGPLAAGLMYDAFGSYTVVLYIAGALYVGSSILLATLGPYPKFAPAHADDATVGQALASAAQA